MSGYCYLQPWLCLWVQAKLAQTPALTLTGSGGSVLTLPSMKSSVQETTFALGFLEDIIFVVLIASATLVEIGFND